MYDAFAQAPVNDEPCNAIQLTVATVCSYVQYSNAGATGSGSPTPPAPGCASYSGGDVWFKVTVPANGIINFDTESGVVSDGGMAIYSGTCGSLTLIECDDDDGAGKMPKINRTGLTPGSTVWIRFWESGNNNNGTFGICLTTAPPNDDPCNAVALTVNSICSYVQYSNENATPSVSPTPTAPGCGSYSGGDVWFTATVPSNGTLVLNTQAGTVTDAAMAIYSGSCSSLTLIECDDDDGVGNMPKIVRSGLTPGSTVWIRVWENGNNDNGTFSICATTTPANDEPCNAITLTPGVSCTYSSYSNENATASISPTPPAPGCGLYSGGDIWFKATVPSNGILTFETQAGTLTDVDMAVYTGSCGALTLVDCDDNNGLGQMPFITRLNLNPGSTVWIRIWDYGGTDEGTFSLCVTTPPPVSACVNNQPAGNTCATARPICSFIGYCGNTSASYTADTWTQLTSAFQTCVPPSSTTGAIPTIENNSFLSFQASATSATFDVWVTSTTNYGGIQMLFFSATGCSGPVSCFGGYNNIIPYQRITASGLTIGNTYYLMVDGYGGDNASYVIDLVNGANILNITASPSTTICAGSSTSLTASTSNLAAGTTYRWTPSTGLNTTTGATVIASPTVTTTYTAAALTGFCTDSTKNEITITVNPPATASAGANQSVCQGGTITLAGLLGGSATLGTWSSSNGGTFSDLNTLNSTYSPSITSGTVQLTLTSNDPDGTGPCTAAASNTLITVNPVLTPTFSACSATVTGVSFSWSPVTGATSYNYTYSINGGTSTSVINTTSTGVNVSGLTSGSVVTITVTPVGAAGTCFASNSQSCTAQSCVPPTVSGTLTVCEGSTTQLSGSGTAAATDPWVSANTGIASVNNSGLVTGVTSGTTGITYNDNTGCTITVNVTVNAKTLPLFTQVSPVCSGGSFSLPPTSNNGIGGTWSPAIDVLNTKTYTFTPTAGQCALGNTMTVNIINLPAAPVASNVSYCQNQAASELTASGSNLLWYTSSMGGTGSATAPTPSTINSGATTYYVSQTVNGCEGPRAPITVTVNALPTVTVNSPTGCIANNVTITAMPGASGSYDYNWSVPTGVSPPANTASFVVTLSGTYSVIIKDKSTNCESSSGIGTATVYPEVTTSQILY